MIISPPSSPGLDFDTYSIYLPDVPINIEPAKAISSAKTISGSGTISVWNGTVIGERREVPMLVTYEQYVQLKAMLDTGFNDWIWRIRGNIYKVVFDMPVAAPSTDRRNGYNISLTFVIKEDLKDL